MSQIVLGIGTSHSPLLAIPPEMWAARGLDDQKRERIWLADGRVVSYPQLLEESGGRYSDDATLENYQAQATMAQQALDRLAKAIEDAAPDVVIIIGDDQEELFSLAQLPSIAIYTGAEIVTHPKGEVSPNLPTWYQAANVGYMMDTVHRHPGAPEIAIQVIEGLVDEGVDVTLASEVKNPQEFGFGHAYGFVIDRLLGRRAVPVMPILLNTYFPPNVPRPGRCWDIGEALGRTIAALPGDLRVCVIASGGLSHFATDSDLDRGVVSALAARDDKAIRALSPLALRSGNSEILNWIMAAGAFEGLEITEDNYIPVYRTAAGTGIGLGFTVWHPAAHISGMNR